MEEARIDLLAQIGWDYPKLESIGIVSPVVSVSCDYKRPTAFSDKITIYAVMKDFGGAKYTFDYEMKNGETVKTLIEYAGNFTSDAYTKNLRITRQNGKEYQV